MDERKREIYESTGRRMRGVYYIFVLLTIAFVARLFYIQFMCEQTMLNSEKMASNIITKSKLQAHRGSILASDGRPLALSVFRYSILIDIASEGCDDEEEFRAQAQELSKRLSEFFRERGENHPSAYYYDLLTSGYRNRIERIIAGTDTVRAPRNIFQKAWERISGHVQFREGDRVVQKYREKRRHTRIRLFRNVDINEWEELSKFPILNMSLGKVFIKERIDTREHPQKGLALRTIGRLEAEHAYGIENSYRDSLAGRDGYEFLQNIAPGLTIRINNRSKYRTVEETDGCDIHTTIDIDVQEMADRALRQQMDAVNGIWGTSIVMETSTGNIVSLVNLDRDSKWGLFEGINHALGTRFEPGSTIKLATVIALLDHASVSTSTMYDSGHGTAQYIGPHNVKVQDAGDDGGVIDMTTAFARSANVYFAKAVFNSFGQNPQKYVDILKSLHLNERLDLGLLTGANPTFKEYKGQGWSAYTLIKLSYGYEIELTPMRIVTLYNAVANGGQMVAPRLITSMTRDGETVATFPTEILSESICSDNTLHTIQSFLREVADSGTGKLYFGPGVNPFRAAAKTGTAQFTQKASINERHYVGSMITYFPADNPKYTIYTAIHKKATDGSSYYGATLAGPVQQAIARFLYGRCKTLAEKVDDVDRKFTPRSMKGGSKAEMKQISDIFCEAAPKAESPWCTTISGTVPEEDVRFDVVPDVGGMGLKDALFILEKAGLKVTYHGVGSVRSQSLEPGREFTEGSRINIELE